MSGPRLKFCPENDLMYPKCDPETRKLIFFCKHCNHEEDAIEDEFCIMKANYKQESKDKITILSGMVADPTLPIARGIECPKCFNNQAVYQAKPTVRGMLLQYQCIKCGQVWTSDT